MFETTAKLLGLVLEFAVLKEKEKYIDRKIALERAYYEEDNKSDDVRSNAVLDNLRAELRILSDAVASEVRKSKA